MRLKSFLPLAFCLAATLATQAQSPTDIQPLTFTFTGANTDSFSFTYDTPITFFYNGRPPYLSFTFYPEPNLITFDGKTYPVLPYSEGLAPEGNGLNLYLYQYSYLDPSGQYEDAVYNEYDFTGNGIYTADYTTDTASFNLGTTTLYENGNPGTLTISVPTPEPATLTLLSTGLLGVGAALRRRRTT